MIVKKVPPSRFIFHVGQYVVWVKKRQGAPQVIPWDKCHIVRITNRKISEFGAVLYRGHDGIWFDEKRVVLVLVPMNVSDLKEADLR